jgi:hypothetical protein
VSDRRVMAALFALAILLYTPGIWWGLPRATAPDRTRPWGADETAPIGAVAELVSVARGGPLFNPQYPLFHYVVQAVLVAPYMAWLKLTGGLGATSNVFPYGLADPETSLAVMTLLARAASLLMAAGLVAISFRAAATLWDRRAGLAAGVFVLALYPMFYFSRTSNVDMGAWFWTGLGVAVWARAVREGLTMKRAVWLGVFAALATATKDASYAIFAGVAVPLAAIHGLRRWKPLVAGAAAGAGVYVVASGLLFSLERFRQHLDFIARGSPGNPSYFSTPPAGVVWEAALHASNAMGLPMTLAAVTGLLVCLRRDRAGASLMLPAAALCAGVLIPAGFTEFRYVAPGAYFLALLAARGVAALPKGPTLAIALIAGWALLRGGDLTWQMLADSRYRAGEWLLERARPGDRVGYYGDAGKLPRLERGIVTSPMPGQTLYRHVAPPEEDAPPPEFVVVVPVQRFEILHEFSMPEATFRALEDGSLGYRLALLEQTPSLFGRIVNTVNPPLRIYVRIGRAAIIPGGPPGGRDSRSARTRTDDR